jgi:ubiquinone/menaquinone biosynthesis C-methylase UbiE
MKNISNFEYTPELYDLQVNWSQRLPKERDFFIRIIKGRNIKSVLDIGCGTGHHAQMFSEYVKDVTAVDPSEEMIEYARKNVVSSANIKLSVGDFENLERVTKKQFDFAVCLGNTIAILGNRRNVKVALKNTRRRLIKSGLAIFQFLNFEPKMIEKNRFYTPKIFKKDDKKYIFMKHFEYGKVKTRADFLIMQLDKNDNLENFHNHSTYLCTLRKNIFLKMAYNAGFKNIELLSTGGEEEFDKNKHISLYALLFS